VAWLAQHLSTFVRYNTKATPYAAVAFVLFSCRYEIVRIQLCLFNCTLVVFVSFLSLLFILPLSLQFLCQGRAHSLLNPRLDADRVAERR
jgi:hypothetical protein